MSTLAHSGMGGSAVLTAGVGSIVVGSVHEAIPIDRSSSLPAACGKWHLLKYNKYSKLQITLND